MGSLSVSHAQVRNLSFNHLTAYQGLSQSINAYILHDSYGFVWLSSLDGLNRFDGVHTKTYREVPGDSSSLLGKNIYSPLLEDSLGNIWFTTLKGLNCYRRDSDNFKRITLRDTQGKAMKGEGKLVHYDKNHKLWIIYNTRLLQYDIDQDSTLDIGNIEGGETKIFTIADSDKQLLVSYWAGQKPGMHIYTLDKKHQLKKLGDFFTRNKSSSGLGIFDVYTKSEKKIWVAARGALILFDLETKETTFFSNALGAKIQVCKSLKSYQDKYLFVSSNLGLLVFDIKQQKFIKKYEHENSNPNSLSGNNISQLYLDRHNNLWASLWGKGVDYANLDKAKFSHINFYQNCGKNQEAIFEPGSILEDRKNQLWLGSNIHGLIAIDKNYKPLKKVCYPDIGVKQLYLDQEGFIWAISWQKKIYRFNDKGNLLQIVQLKDLQNTSVGDLLQLNDGRIILCGYETEGLFELVSNNSSQYKLVRIENPEFLSNHFDRGYQAKNGKVLISTNDLGLSIFTYEEGKFKLDAELRIDAEVKSFFEDEQGSYWLATTDGLISLDLETYTWRVFGEKMGLKSPYIYGILPDHKNHLWLSTNRGIFSFNKADTIFKGYGLEDGLQGFEYNTTSFLKTHNNQFWFGGTQGYNIFEPDKIKELPHEAIPNIIGLLINDTSYTVKKNVTLLDTVTLSYEQNTFSLNLVSTEYSFPTSNKLRYRLVRNNGKAYDRDWIEVSNNQTWARYPKVAPGSYQLLIQASNSDGIWNEKSKTVFIQVAPPFWMRPWFIILCILALAGLIWLGVRRYVKNRLRLKNLKIREQKLELDQQKTLETERRRIARDMHDDLGTGLTQIRRVAIKAKLENELKSIKGFLDQMEEHSVELVQNMQGIIWAMDSGQSSLEELIAYIRRYSVETLSTENIDSKVTTLDEWPKLNVSAEIKRTVFLSVKEAIHNILKHANASKVEIEFNWDKALYISIADNGVGMDINKQDSMGNGLKNMQSRMKEVKGIINFQHADKKGLQLSFSIPI